MPGRGLVRFTRKGHVRMEGFDRKFGFGFMRLPMDGDQVDIPQTTQMVDEYLNAGFTYFDTAHGYLQGKSEQVLKTCLTSRYPRLVALQEQ